MEKTEFRPVEWRMPDGNIVQLEIHSDCVNTAALARSYAEANYPDRYAVFCERRRREVPGTVRGTKTVEEKGIFLSLILRPSFFASQAGFLRLISGLSMASALEKHTDASLGVGWVSDLFCRGRRIGESSVEGKLNKYSSFDFVLIHFYAVLPERHFSPQLTDIVTQIFEEENLSFYAYLVKEMLEKFFTYLQNLKTPAKFMDAYRDCFVLRGVRAHVKKDGERKRCKILGVDATDGTLMIELSDGAVERIANRAQIELPKKLPSMR